jgi:hypothetical protein
VIADNLSPAMRVVLAATIREKHLQPDQTDDYLDELYRAASSGDGQLNISKCELPHSAMRPPCAKRHAPSMPLRARCSSVTATRPAPCGTPPHRAAAAAPHIRAYDTHECSALPSLSHRGKFRDVIFAHKLSQPQGPLGPSKEALLMLFLASAIPFTVFGFLVSVRRVCVCV